MSDLAPVTTVIEGVVLSIDAVYAQRNPQLPPVLPVVPA